VKGFFYLFFPFLLFSSAVHAQEDLHFERDNFVRGTFQYMMPDEIGNLFALTNTGQLKKYNPNLDSMGVFNEVRRYGRLHSISANNPLRSLLYFKEYRTIIVLDRLMQMVNKIDLRKAGIFQVQAVAQSYDNKIWVFDEQESKIRKLDEEGRIIFSTADLRLVFSTPFSPTVLFDMGGYIYLYDPIQGLFIFDYYGALKNKVALLGWRDVQPMGKQVVGFRDNQLMIYTPGSIDLKEIKLPADLLQNTGIRFSTGGFFVLKPEGIQRYKWR
jgi:hypothetical protein